MAYTEQEWKDGRAGGTPITASRLNHMEDGIKDASDRADAIESQLGNVATVLDEINGVEV